MSDQIKVFTTGRWESEVRPWHVVLGIKRVGDDSDAIAYLDNALDRCLDLEAADFSKNRDADVLKDIGDRLDQLAILVRAQAQVMRRLKRDNPQDKEHCDGEVH